MSDFNGRIGGILHAVEKSDGDQGELSYYIRNVLRKERADGWGEGHSDGHEDCCLTYRPKLEAAEKERDEALDEVERLKGLLAAAGIEDTDG